jgi:hypothetical protein
MNTNGLILAQIRNAIRSTTAEDLARQLMSYGMEFENPPAKIVTVSDRYEMEAQVGHARKPPLLPGELR